MKKFSTNLLQSVGNTYDKTRTTRSGIVNTRTINSKTVIGPPLSKFLDVFTDTLGGFSPGLVFASPNNRVYILLSAPAAGIANQIAMYDFNTTTGVSVYVGRIAFSFAVAPTVRGFKVDDSNPANIKIFLQYVSATVTVGGLMMINRVATTDFVQVGFPTFFTAIANDVKACYNLLSPVELGGANLHQAATGISVAFQSSNAAINTKVYAHNGVAATHQLYAFDYSIAPQMAGLGTSTVTAANTTGVNTTFTMAGNTLAVNDTVVITSNPPTGYTATTNATAQTVYFVVATNFVSGSTFSLSTTLGGAIINGSTAVGTTTFVRALGQSSSLFFGKTANLPALAGTMLLTNSEDYAMPAHTANSGFDCIYFATSTTQYLGRYTDLFSVQTGTLNATINVTGLTSTAALNVGQLVTGTGIPVNTTIATIVSATAITLSNAATTSGATSLTFGASFWLSLVNSNLLGNGLDYLAVTPVNAAYSSYADSAIFNVNGIFCLTKKFVNSVIQSSVGVASQIYLEGQNHVTDQFSTSAISAIETRNGWLFATGTAVGQRGIVAMHIGSDAIFDINYIISAVQYKPNSLLYTVSTVEELFDVTGAAEFYYRDGNAISDSVFNTASGGWVEVSTAADLSAIVVKDYIQFKVKFVLSTKPTETTPSVTTPTQISDLTYSTIGKTELSDFWDYSYSASSTLIPTRVGFALRNLYPSVVPAKIFYRAYDTSGALLVNHNTVDNAANFQYSTNNGSTWLPLGTIPNTVGTLLRYTYTTPPGVDIRAALQDV